MKLKRSVQPKIRLGILFGGQSAEHNISIQSAKSIIEQIDSDKYDIFPIGIDKRGCWHFFKPQPFLRNLKNHYPPTFSKKDPLFPCLLKKIHPNKLLIIPPIFTKNLDVIFPILHGPFGEDGTIQGLCELAHLPYIGSNHLSSAICMDKGIMKQILKGQNLPVANYRTLHFDDPLNEKKIIEALDLPLFIKPAQMGSSIGISKVCSPSELIDAIKKGFQYDERILIEQCIDGREIECSVLGNRYPEASLPGEILPTHEFYSYRAKYRNKISNPFIIPAQLEIEKRKEIQELSIRVFKIFHCEGMARIDFFLKKDGTIIINELNTIPGFTPISLYPKLWEVSGVGYSQLIERLIALAIQRYKRKKCFIK